MPEYRLHSLALSGGFLGCAVGMILFHHKVLKWYFKAVIISATLLHGFIYFALSSFFPWLYGLLLLKPAISVLFSHLADAWFPNGYTIHAFKIRIICGEVFNSMLLQRCGQYCIMRPHAIVHGKLFCNND